MSKDKRILWLLNHTTLRDYEVKLLHELGYEIFTPKSFPLQSDFRSASVTYHYDQFLTIPKDALDELNTQDFYSGHLSIKARQILNTYFGTACMLAYTPMITAILKYFHGRMLLRAFGLAAESSYLKLFSHGNTLSLMRNFYAAESRFWFGAILPGISNNEPDFFQRRSLILPPGLPEKFFEMENSWEGGNKEILFICPSIASSGYYEEIYNDFKKHFGDLPYIVGGEQPIAVKNNPRVKGKLPRDEYDAMMKQSRVMFYHSREPRHLHYHPLEAILMGMPLIYMSGGVLDLIANDPNLPGRAVTYKEARKKIKRLLKGDMQFAAEIQRTQREFILPYFMDSNVRAYWQLGFVNQLMNTPVPPRTPPKKIAVMLPIAYRGGSLRAAKNLAKMVKLGSQHAGDHVDVVFSYTKGANYHEDEFADLHALNITTRETQWESVRHEDAQAMHHLNTHLPQRSSAYLGNYSLPKDGICDFMDCDHWILISDRTEFPLLPLKPFSLMVYDYLQRYVPESVNSAEPLSASSIENAHNADIVLTTTHKTSEDAVQFLGVNAGNILQIPNAFDPLPHPPTAHHTAEPYFLWTTNTAPHKNHLRAVEALAIYYHELNGSLRCIMCGVNTEQFDAEYEEARNGYVTTVVNAIKQQKLENTHLEIAGEVPDILYTTLLAGAAFLWHPASADNGTFSVVEAAWNGVPSLSSDYPQMREISQQFALDCDWSDAFSARQMAEALKAMESAYPSRKTMLPSRDLLSRFHYETLAPNLWATLRDVL